MYNVYYATGSRADYGIVRKYLSLLEKEKDINLSILVTGTHLEKEYGYTKNLILEDKHKIEYEVYLNLTENLDVTEYVATTIKEFGAFFKNNNVDLLIILGDRYEMLGVAVAAALNKIKILHIHGGEATFENYDEFIRHSITKMSLYHFTATEKYKNRVIQLGEEPGRVFNLGALGAENCREIDISNVSDEVRLMQDDEYFVVLFHPETLNNISEELQIEILLEAISKFKMHKFVFLGSNADTNSYKIREAIKKYVKSSFNSVYFENLNPDTYHYLVKNSICLIGNSSSGIIEAPSLGTYTINIGDRQKGREIGNSVISVKTEEKEIVNAINSVLNNKKDKEKIFNPYETVETAYKYCEKTVNILRSSSCSVAKKFYDFINL